MLSNLTGCPKVSYLFLGKPKAELKAEDKNLQSLDFFEKYYENITLAKIDAWTQKLLTDKCKFQLKTLPLFHLKSLPPF